MKLLALLTLLFLLAVDPVAAQPEDTLVDTTKGVIGKVGSAVGGTAKALGGTVKDVGKKLSGGVTPAEARKEIDTATGQSLSRLFKEDKNSRKLFDRSYGYAVFDSRKFSFLITTGFGGGVAVNKGSGKRTYMKMATGGVNLGAGVQYFQLVFLFENKKSFDNFVNRGWEASGQASAVFGRDSVETEVRFVEGKAIYQLTDTGIMLDMNLTGTKYWKDGGLNS